MSDTERIAELERLLREEREFRTAAEQRVGALTDKTELWRRRAEERAERIDRLVAESDLPAVRRLAGRVRRAVGRAPQAGTAPPPAGPPSLPLARVLPGVRIAAAVSSAALTPCLTASDMVDVASPSVDPFADADVIVVEPLALAGLSGDARARFESWLRLDARQPLVVWVDGGGGQQLIPSPLRPGDVVAATRRRDVAELRDSTDHPVHHLAATFDPSIYSPGRPRTAPRLGMAADNEGAAIAGDAALPEAVWVPRRLLDDPPSWLLDLAGMALPVVPGPSGQTPAPWAGAAARRWANTRHAPWVRTTELLRLAGVDFPDPVPTVAALLVSNRPGEVPAAVARIAAQTHRPLEIVVGLHGVAATREIEAAVAAAGVPATLVALDERWSLGECLNRVASLTPASVLAKIDDDDHYGPGYLEDAVQALRYSGAGVVVKAAQFTYMAGRDETVLRRSRQEETMLEGATTGATFVARRQVWDAVRFPHRTRGEDTRFLRGVRALGVAIYANSRWEFCYVRRVGHTWTAADETFLAGAETAWEGFHPERVEVPDLLAP